MELVLLGTAGAGGWPNAFCTCASCQALRAAGEVRGQTAVLVDDTLLLDCGPEAPRAAVHAGRTLAGVRHVLLTHDHPDHVDPMALLTRGWTGTTAPLDVIGPPTALARCRDWIGPSDPVRLRPVAPGDVLRLGGHAVRVLEANHPSDAVLYDVTGPDGVRLLYATDTGPLPESTLAGVRDASYDVVLLEETFGDRLDHAGDHLDLTTFPVQLARLRQLGAVTEATEIVAIHLSHFNPPTPELTRRLAAWGARVRPDGAVWTRTATAAPPAQPRQREPHRVLLLGGARSGKSVEAERRLAACPSVTYVATGGVRADDPEWADRVAAHQARRPAHWRTVEIGRSGELAELLRAATGPVLVDCLTLWLTAVLDECDAWDDSGNGQGDTITACVDELVAAFRATRATVVAVSNEVGSGVVPATASGRRFRDELGRLNARIAAEADEVVWMVAGQAVPLRGGSA